MTASRAVRVAEPSTQSRPAGSAYPGAKSTLTGVSIWLRCGRAGERPGNRPRAAVCAESVSVSTTGKGPASGGGPHGRRLRREKLDLVGDDL